MSKNNEKLKEALDAELQDKTLPFGVRTELLTELLVVLRDEKEQQEKEGDKS